jgi:hypothetical protein
MPRHIRESIKHLRIVFEQIKTQRGKDIIEVFQESIDRETGDIPLRVFVEKLLTLDPTLNKDQLYRTCHQLDEDNSGSISIDEFISYFGSASREDDEMEQAKQDQMLEDEIWPAWVIQEKALPNAQTILSNMFKCLERNYSISAEQAFGIYDMKDTGICT